MPIYLDHHATTPCDPRVVEAMLPFFTQTFGNPSSLTHEHGRRASNALEDARITIARFFGVQPNEMVFTAGATESNNIALRLVQSGEHFVTTTRRPILLLEEDATPGIHDMLCAACDPARYSGLGVEGWHASCEENLQTALRAVGVEPPRFAPQPINLFMNTPARADGTIDWLPAPTEAGGSVLMRAELDLVLVVSACPQDIIQINEGKPSPVEIELL